VNKVFYAIISVIICSLLTIVAINMSKAEKPHPSIIEINSFDVDSMLRSHSNVVAIKGTGSMRPLIPAGKPDEIVAWAVVDNSRDFALLSAGDIVVFTHKNGGLIIHELNVLDGEGWISSGSYNKFYDSGRVTRQNLRGVVTSIYKLKQ
jgi:hypothetical protein